MPKCATTGLTPLEIRETSLKRVTEIHVQMQRVSDAIGFKGT